MARESEPSAPLVSFQLECVECRATSDEALGWKAYLDDDDQLVTYCAECAWREFGHD